jgi:hypothetical protein
MLSDFAVTRWKPQSSVTNIYQVYNGNYRHCFDSRLTRKNPMTNLSSCLAPDLAQRAPRSLRCRLGGYAVLPRLIDKCRAAISGKIGDYHTNCPLDKQFLDFTGIDYARLRSELAQGRTDGEMLQWVTGNSKTPRTTWEIKFWSEYQDNRLPDSDAQTMEFFSGTLLQISRTRLDIHTWADLLDLDDYVSFGGSA